MSTKTVELTAKKPGLPLMVASKILPGVRKVTSQTEPYTQWWSNQNSEALEADGPLMVVLGDSMALGVGGSAPNLSYVGRLQRSLSSRDQTTWRVINMAQSGAKIVDGLERQVKVFDFLERLGQKPDLSIVWLGANDLVWGRKSESLPNQIEELVGLIPTPGVVCTIGGDWSSIAEANKAIESASALKGLDVINPWSEPGPSPRQRTSTDFFHPNDLGYELMAKAFNRHFGLPI